MVIKYLCQVGLISMCLLGISASTARADNPMGQTFQLTADLNSYVGKPQWVLILRDVNTGRVMPYIFPINKLNNVWVGFTLTRAYRVTVSRLQFGPPETTITNFCHLEDGIITGKSLIVRVSGDLTPNRHTATCHVTRYAD